MRVQFAKTTGWYKEGGASTWGLGVEVHNYAGMDDEGDLHPEGWELSILVGPWAVQIYDEGGFKAIHGDSVQYYGTFSVARP